MKPEALIKKELIKESSKNPQKFYPIKSLEVYGFKRYTCSKSGVKFWSTIKRDVCGETEYVGGYTFINNSPTKSNFSFTQVYDSFSKFMKKRKYTPIKRFPVVARWRDDLDFNIASIVGFQPYVVKGEVAPPANPLTIPQICLRFPDIDNVGYTGRHHTGFTMIGQHAFVSPKEYDINKYFTDWLEWYVEELKLPLDEIVIHEDAWAGGGNCGASLEIFSRGLELGNQVYMAYDMTDATKFSELKELDLKVLDMGMGQERLCWISSGAKNSYDACMPKVCKYLFEKANFKADWKIYDKFLPHSGILNLDEVDDINKAWEEIAKECKLEVSKLKEKINPIAGIYAIADHTRTLLYALTDGALPSNVKGGYNLRLILRRSLDFIKKYNWNIDLYEVIKLHATELEMQYPELKTELKGIKEIIEIEKVRYDNHKQKVEQKIQNMLKKKEQPSDENFIKYYISEGITPEEIKESFDKIGFGIDIPNNFFTLVTDYFESQKVSSKKENQNELLEYLKGIVPTEILYYDDIKKSTDDVKIIKEFEHNKKKFIVLDKTLFYPTGGGQLHDVGFIGDKEVVNVFKVGQVIVHQVK